MCAEKINDLFHFMGIEKNNELVQMANMGDDYFLIHNLDTLYTGCLNLKPIDEDRLKIPMFLYLVVHNEYYHSMSSFLRMHSSKSFISLRIAIDCSLAGYYLLKHPDKKDIYLDKDHPEWKKIFINIKKTIKHNKDDFPLADGLPEIHEVCSSYAHSDASGIGHRYRIDREKMRMESTYFDYEDNHDDYKKRLSCLLIGYFVIFKLFWKELYIHRAEDKYEHMQYSINGFEKHLKVFHEKYPLVSP